MAALSLLCLPSVCKILNIILSGRMGEQQIEYIQIIGVRVNKLCVELKMQ